MNERSRINRKKKSKGKAGGRIGGKQDRRENFIGSFILGHLIVIFHAQTSLIPSLASIQFVHTRHFSSPEKWSLAGTKSKELEPHTLAPTTFRHSDHIDMMQKKKGLS